MRLIYLGFLITSNCKQLRKVSIRMSASSSSNRADIIGLTWNDLQVPPHEMRPNLTLAMGQCFNWNKLCTSGDFGLWVGMVNGRGIAIKQSERTTFFAPLTAETAESISSISDDLRAYFQLDVYNLTECYREWALSDQRMKIVVEHLPGVRVVRQDPWECLISFICSSNNNIKRITLMIDRLRRTYGHYVCSLESVNGDGVWRVIHDERTPSRLSPATSSMLSPPIAPSSSSKKRKEQKLMAEEETEDEEPESVEGTGTGDAQGDLSRRLDLYTFPTHEALATASEEHLRSMGMGYRAKFILGSALRLQELGGLQWLLALRNGLPIQSPSLPTPAATFSSGSKGKKKTPSPPSNSRLYVQEQLLQFPGCGRKVADCISVFSLDQSDAIPVDTHVWAIAVRDYNASLALHNSITPTVYEAIGDEFRSRFTRHAGWAHSVLFAAELPEFRSLLPNDMQADMKAFAELRAQGKKAKRELANEKKKLKSSADTTSSKKSESKTSGSGASSSLGLSAELESEQIV